MSDQPDNLVKLLELYGLNKDESDIYLFLLKNNEQSALEISKQLRIARTKIYRIIEKLLDKGLIKERIKGYGRKFEAVSYEKFSQFISTKEEELETLKLNAPKLFNQLASIQNQSSNEYKILHYRGIEGLKQLTWNTTKAKSEFRIYEINNMESFLPNAFSEKVRKEFAKNQIQIKQLTNHSEMDDYTDVQEVLEYWEVRYIDPKELEMNFEVAIYDDVYCMYSYENNDIFCVEIYNSKLAKMQKQLFDFIWNYSHKMDIVGKGGAVKLAK